MVSIIREGYQTGENVKRPSAFEFLDTTRSEALRTRRTICAACRWRPRRRFDGVEVPTPRSPLQSPSVKQIWFTAYSSSESHRRGAKIQPRRSRSSWDSNDATRPSCTPQA